MTGGTRKEIADRNAEKLTQPEQLFGRNARTRSLVFLDAVPLDSESRSDFIFRESQCQALALNPPGNMPINWCQFSEPTLRYFFIIKMLIRRS